MAIQFLQFVNAVLKRTGEIAGDSEELATSTVTSTATGAVATEAFTDSRRQHKIDVVLQITNEAIHEVNRMGLFAQEGASATMLTVADQREYDFPSDFERMAGPLRGVTNGLIIHEYPGGYGQMLIDQPTASDYRGQPQFYAISPVQSKIRLSATPDSGTASETYNYLYHKRISLSSTMATTAMPFSDTVSDSLVPVVTEAYHRVFKKDVDANFLTNALSRSLSYLSQKERRDRYGRRRV